jgi:N-acetylmuramoyl-L-alanine amidase
MRKINKIILHCSATPEGKDYTVEQIREWHVKGNGWKDIGYHFVIYRDGSIHTGRPVEQVGAHCKGHNANSIGVCYIGGITEDNVPKDTRTDAQKKAMREFVKTLQSQYPGATVHCHNEFANKACPSFKLNEL